MEITDSAFAFFAQIESQWDMAQIDTNGRYLYKDNRKTRVYIERVHFDTISGLKEQDFARIYFMSSYSLAEQWGKVKFYDTSYSVKSGDLRAYELCAFYKDTSEGKLFWWAEYCRWCAQGDYVYQVMVLGDTLDIKENIAQYKAILNSFKFWCPQKAAIIKKCEHKYIKVSFPDECIVDLCGRSMKSRRKAASGFYLYINSVDGRINKSIIKR